MPCKATSILIPHVLGILASMPLAELLPGIGFEIVQIRFVVAVSIVLTELLEYFQVVKDLCDFGVGFK
jgi:hypothetical protein